MPNFVYDTVTLAYPKSDLGILPPGADVTKYVIADNWNLNCQSMMDVRGAIRAGRWFGFGVLSTDPAPAGVTAYIWHRDDGKIIHRRPDASSKELVEGSREIIAGTGLSGGGTLDNDVTITHPDSGVTPDTYTNATVTVDALGHITSASSGSGFVPTTRKVDAGTGLSGGGDLSADRTISHATSGVTGGTYNYITVDVLGHATLGLLKNYVEDTRQVLAGTALTGGGNLSADRTISHGDSAVTPGSYSMASLTVDQQGHITLISSGSGVPDTRRIDAGTALSGGGNLTADRTISHSDSAVVPGTYNLVAVNQQGHITSGSSVAYVESTRKVDTGDGLTGGGDLSADRTIEMETLDPSPAGSYTIASVTVDALGRVTAASSGSAGATTLQGAYDGGGAGPQVIQLDDVRLGVIIRDSLSTSNPIFSVQKSDSTQYFTVLDAGAIQMAGAKGSIQMADGASADQSAASTGTLRYLAGSTNKFQVSQNTGAWKSLLLEGEGMSMGGTISGSPLEGSVLFVGTAGILQQDNTNLFWDNSNHSLRVAYPGMGTNTTNIGLWLYGGDATAGVVTQYSPLFSLRGAKWISSASQPSSITFQARPYDGYNCDLYVVQDCNGVRTTISRYNSNDNTWDFAANDLLTTGAITAYQFQSTYYGANGNNEVMLVGRKVTGPSVYIQSSQNIPATSLMTVFENVSGVRVLGIYGSGALELANGSGTGLSPANKGIFRYNTTGHKFQVSCNGGAYTDVAMDGSLYALLAGRAGGQTLIGGTGTTDDLVLQATAGVGASGSDIIFKVGDKGATEAMRILYDGRVGIGTASPGTKLHVHDTGGSRIYISTVGPGVTLGNNVDPASASSYSAFGLATGNSFYVSGSVSGDTCVTTNGGSILFGTNGDYDTAATLRLKIANDGATTVYNTLYVNNNGIVFYSDNTASITSGDGYSIVTKGKGNMVQWFDSDGSGGGANNFSVVYGTGGGTTMLLVDSLKTTILTPQLGIGTSSPLPSWQVQVASNSGVVFGLSTYVESAGGSTLYLHKARGSLASPTEVHSGDYLGSLYWMGQSGTGAGDGVQVAYVSALAAQAFTSTAYGTHLVFGTAKLNQGAPNVVNERMRITSEGLVGIGTDSPGTLLDVHGDVTTTTKFIAAAGVTYGFTTANICLVEDVSNNAVVHTHSTGGGAVWLCPDETSGFQVAKNLTVLDLGNSTHLLAHDSSTGYLWWNATGLAADTNLYRSSANTLKTDDSFVILGQVAIGTASPSGRLIVQGGSGEVAIVGIANVADDSFILTNTNVSGYSSFRFNKSDTVNQGGVGYANASANVTLLRNKLYLNSIVSGTDVLVGKAEFNSYVIFSDNLATITGALTVSSGTTPTTALLLDMAQPGSSGTRDSHAFLMRGTSYDTGGHNADWKQFVDVTSNAAVSHWKLQTRIDSGSYATKLSVFDDGGLQLDDGSSAAVSDSGAARLRYNGSKLQVSENAGSYLYVATDSKGSDVASANDVTLGIGNVFSITGSTQINTIVTTGFHSGSHIVLIFASTPTVKHLTAGSGAQLKLAGSADFNAAADSILGLVYDGTNWQETFRKVA